ncbi:uncharacterized protein LOC132098335 isoform X2 [Carassius carassius]|uniref:uncharacterized protein LOC132098335 isoform X2 n=1 Tax=Carassius carassius TaxID=217509 RepID=UPI002868B771|nr:uncharacterized protein LOC132098335 isoform X2 [Carassius carassius]
MSTKTERSESENAPVARAAWASEASSLQRIDLIHEIKDNSTADKGKEGKAKASHIFFQKLCAAVKHPDKVVRFSAQTDAHLNDPEVTAVPGASAVPELLCLPGQVFEDPECSSWIREPMLHPDPSALKTKKGRKKRAVPEFFRKTCEAVKQLFPCCDQVRVQPPKAEPDLDQSQLVLPEQDQVSADLQSSPEEEVPSEIQALDAVLACSVSGSVSSLVSGPVSGSVSGSVSSSVLIRSEMALDTVLPDPEITLTQGESLQLYFHSVIFSYVLLYCSAVHLKLKKVSRLLI